MEIKDDRIDSGKAFDWGKTSREYAKYRDIYPEKFYQKIVDRGLCIKGQRVLDIGTGTGVLPRNMYKYGASWTGTDISPEQIEQAKILADASKLKIDFQAVPTEQIDFEEESFDVITACQCFWYFDHEKVMPELAGFLKSDGRMLILYMAWLPYEDRIAGASEELVLKYSPKWSGAGETRHPIWIPDIAYEYFELEDHEEYDLMVPFTKESWHGRMRACRGVGASLSEEELARWDREHRELLDRIAPEEFEVKHYAALAVLRKREELWADLPTELPDSDVLITRRLILRRWKESDAEDLYKYASDPEVGPIAGWPAHQSIAESRDVIKNVFNGKEAYAICLKEDGKAIGAIELKLNGYTDMTDRDDECEMGYWLGKPFWGQGIMPEAVKEMLRHAFEDCGMQKVWIGYYEGNNKSKRVQEKCGFKYQWRSENVDVPLMHEKRTGHVSLMTKEDWVVGH